MTRTTRNLHLRGDHADRVNRGHRHLGLPCPWGKNGQFLTNAHYVDFDFVVTVNFALLFFLQGRLFSFLMLTDKEFVNEIPRQMQMQMIIQRIWPLPKNHLEDPASCK